MNKLLHSEVLLRNESSNDFVMIGLDGGAQ